MYSSFSFINDAGSVPKISIQTNPPSWIQSFTLDVLARNDDPWRSQNDPDYLLAYEIGVDLFRMGETKNKKLGITDNENELAKNGHSDRGARLLSKSLNLDSRKR